MAEISLYPHLKRARQILPNGWHSVMIESISERREPNLGDKRIVITFASDKGVKELPLPIAKESVMLLNDIAGIVGVTAEKYRLSDLVGETLLIQIKYKRVIKIKSHEKTTD